MKAKTNNDLKFLIDVKNDVEACVIQGLLDSCGINAELRYDTDVGMAKVIIGKSMMPVSIYVKEEDYESAYEIINAKFQGENIGIEE